MDSRLVLGCGEIGRAVLANLEGAATVVVGDRETAATVQAQGHEAIHADPTEPTALADLATPSVIIVATDGEAATLAATRHAAEQFPSALVIATTPSEQDELAAHADVVVSGADAVAGWLEGATDGPSGDRPYQLRRTLAGIDGKLAIVTHDNPDPDAIASALALDILADSVGTPADTCYYGEISHQENRAMVNLLDVSLRNLSPTEPLDEYAGFALVDHARPGVNDQLPAEISVDVVIDHHPPGGPVAADFYDCRVDAGATSTVMTEYLAAWDHEPASRIASALLFGIRVDTSNFTRQVAPVDLEAVAWLWPHVDHDTLERIEQPTIEGETLEAIARAIKNRNEFGSTVVANAGELSSRDALPQAADQLLSMEGIRTTLVFGFMDEMVYLSARSRESGIDLGETLRDAFDPIGSGGGHGDMAGAQLEIGVIGGITDAADRSSLHDVVEEVITDRFFEALRSRPGTPVEAFRETSEWLFEPESD